MAIDANILAQFGEPPEGLDLEETDMWRSDVGLYILIALAVVSVLLRYVARFLQKAGFKADDYFMILAVVRVGRGRVRQASRGHLLIKTGPSGPLDWYEYLG